LQFATSLSDRPPQERVNMKALSRCANGDGRPVCPPSKVLCRQCMDKVAGFLEFASDDLRRRQAQSESSQTVKQQAAARNG